MNTEESLTDFKDQNYERLKSYHNESNLFEDPYFQANSRSVFTTRYPPYGLTWMRPSEAVHDPKFNVDGFHYSDLHQGAVGNCYFIASIGSIMKNKMIFDYVCPTGQSFEEDYAGIFHFRFWIYGKWTDVVVDDRLPFLNGVPYFCRNKKHTNEFWPCLLEKAYAKVYGDYENLTAGYTHDALTDLSGGIQEKLTNSLYFNYKDEFWKMVTQMWMNDALIGCTTQFHGDGDRRGLVLGHAYSITKLVTINNKKFENLRLLRIRNPWADTEWNGAWSDDSDEWNYISDKSKEKLELKKENDGEFWMNLDDYLVYFGSTDVAHLGHKWNCLKHDSRWITGFNSGGSPYYGNHQFWTNPQFLFHVKGNKDNEGFKSSILIALMQKYSRQLKIQDDQIEFILFRVKDEVEFDPTQSLRFYASELERISGSSTNITREVVKRFIVRPGYYVVLPHTFYPNRDKEFHLRIFTELDMSGMMTTLEDFKLDLDSEDTYFEAGSEDEMSKFMEQLRI